MAKSKADAAMKRRKASTDTRSEAAELVKRMQERQALREKELTAITEADVRRAERTANAQQQAARLKRDDEERKRNKVVGTSVAEAMRQMQEQMTEHAARELERQMGLSTWTPTPGVLGGGVVITSGDPWYYPPPITSAQPPAPKIQVIGISPEWLIVAYERAAASDCMITLQIGALGIEVMAQDGDGYVIETATWKDMKGDTNPLLDLIVKAEKAIYTRGVLVGMVASGNK